MKYVIYLILLALIVGGAIGAFHLYRVSVKNKKEMSKFEGKKVELKKDLGKVLVIYYSLSGKTKDIAEQIQTKTNADIYEIKTKEPLPTGPKLYMSIKQQIKSGEYPELAGNTPDFSQYDVIFVGAPVWWYTAATPMLSFLKETDFGGKKVVPFSTQGSNVGTYFTDFAKMAKNAKLLKSEQFNNLPAKYNAEVDAKISTWLNALDI